MQVTGFNTELFAQVSTSINASQVTKSEDGQTISVNLRQTSVLSFSQQRSNIGHASLSNALSHNVKINGQQPDVKGVDEKSGAFDYQKVADNVMNFVSQTIMARKQDGASDDEIKDLLSQARQGIDQGFSEAKEELEGLGVMNDELATGIDKAYDELGSRMNKLEEQLFGEPVDSTRRTAAVSDFSYSASQTGDLTIRTKDGDVVTLNFENIQQFAQRTSVASQQSQGAGAAGNSTYVESQENEQASASVFDQLAANLDEDGNVTSFAYQEGYESSYSSEEQYAIANSDQNGTNAIIGKTSYQHYESQSLAFSVEGELDEDELAAIGSLVNDLAKVSDEFFNGDAFAAFEMGLSLGYNEDELAGFSMNLQSVETTRLTQVYQDVVQASPAAGDRPALPASVAQPLQNYGQQMAGIVGQADEKLEGKDAIKEMINEVMNKQLELLQEQLKESESQFNKFNNAIVDGLLS